MRKPDVMIAMILASIVGLIAAAVGLRNTELDSLLITASNSETQPSPPAPFPDSSLLDAPNAGLDVADLATKAAPGTLGSTASASPTVPKPSQPIAPANSTAPPPQNPVAIQPRPSTVPPVSQPAPAAPPPASAAASSGFQPPQYRADVHTTNFGERYAQDAYGQPATQNWIAVIHETAGSARSAIYHFQTPHPNDADQASYHALITIKGEIVYLVPPEKRAFGAGNSVFDGPNGLETIKTNPNLPPSVNNFAYHVSLETPPDGYERTPEHSGYSDAQYRALAWLIARTGIPYERVTTHAAVDRSGTRSDPRSFDPYTFQALLARYR